MHKNRYERLYDCVTSWDTLFDGFKYFYLYNYYPLTSNFSVTQEEWAIRKLIWDFKYNPDKTHMEAHKAAVLRIVLLLRDFLIDVFKNHTSSLTFVCIPASTSLKNEIRYKMFSEMLCWRLGMTNAYPKIQIIHDKIEKRLGGTKLYIENIAFDEKFFLNRNILLFDDVITTGDSMRKFDLKMKELGANVVGGISIGKTTHERIGDNPIQLFQNKYIK
ncbi:hypothetical protein K6V25_07085 [Bacteroides salyersiae]|uniref:phosphoribosyltransferase n=1 Tax=Bacteroides salyersiae TaxID=291644 RepID=UPI00189C5566|nr:hypothetical protein [Bacteroides salyersiae]UBD66580.1 hypothetical protein K6V25_07085 [Bacteroides salyersiae]